MLQMSLTEQPIPMSKGSCIQSMQVFLLQNDFLYLIWLIPACLFHPDTAQAIGTGYIPPYTRIDNQQPFQYTSLRYNVLMISIPQNFPVIQKKSQPGFRLRRCTSIFLLSVQICLMQLQAAVLPA